MNFDNYQDAAARTAKTNVDHALTVIEAINASPRLARIIIAALKLTSETGELNDTLVKHLAYGKELDFDNLEEELGDIMWYVSDLITACDFDIRNVLNRNIQKLKIRYPEKFTEKDAVERKDKVCHLCGGDLPIHTSTCELINERGLM